MSTSYIQYPAKGVPIFPTAAQFPPGGQIGALAVAADTGGLYEWRGVSWVLLADPSVSPLAIDALFGDVSATGPGVVAATVNSVGGQSAAAVAAAAAAVAAGEFLKVNGTNSPTATINWGAQALINASSLLVGSTTVLNAGAATTDLISLIDSSNAKVALAVSAFGAATNVGPLLNMSKAGGTFAAPTKTLNNSQLATLNAFSYETGTNTWIRSAQIQVQKVADANNATSGGALIQFFTAAPGDTVAQARWVINSTGELRPTLDAVTDIGTNATQARNLYLSSFLSQAQIATPANPAAGKNRLYFKAGDGLYSLSNAGVEVQYLTGSTGANVFLSNLQSPTAINQSLLFGVDNSVDIGASGASRPANIYVGTQLTVPLVNGNSPSGLLRLRGGASSGAATGGAIIVEGGAGLLTRTGGLATLEGGVSGASPGANGGGVQVRGRDSSATGSGGSGGGVNVFAGNASGDTSVARNGGGIQIAAGSAVGAGSGGGLSLQSGAALDAGGTGGDISLNAHAGGTGGANGSILFLIENTDVGRFRSTGDFELFQPVAPVASDVGANTLYFKADDKLYSQNSAGVEVLIGPENAPITVSDEVYVSVNGSDITGDGTENNPWASVTYAYSQITTATTAAPWVINVGPGTYSETNVLVKPNIFLNGLCLDPTTVSVSGSWSLDPSWTTEPSGHYGAANMSLQGTVNFDFSGATVGFSSKSTFLNCQVEDGFTVTGRSGQTDLFVLKNSAVNGDIVQHGGALGLVNTQVFDGGNLTYDMGSLLSESGELVLTGSQVLGGSISISTSDPSNNVIYYGLASTCAGNQTFDGALLVVNVDAVSLSTKGNVTLLNSPTINRLNDAYDLGYSPAVPSDWSPTPTVVQDALDQLAARTFSQSPSVTNPGGYPYTVLSTDKIVQVNTSAARTINLEPSASTVVGQVLYIKDHTGNASTNNISVVPNGAETLDGMASASITADYGVMRLYSDGSNWFSL